MRGVCATPPTRCFQSCNPRCNSQTVPRQRISRERRIPRHPRTPHTDVESLRLERKLEVRTPESVPLLPRRRFARESRCERPEARARAVFTLPATHTTTRYGSSESAATRPSGPSHQGHRKWACSRGPVLLAVGSLRWPAAQQERRQSKVTGAGTCAPGLPTHHDISGAQRVSLADATQMMNEIA